ncbi:hypothetical protein B0H17DRAFT_1179385 [Mycena rosella]|uniref:NmrA-like domain-containing protein n=1 Tax=Mycena rosella TaxID=1033263 RepID=A0AAD7GI79_MYCRO|nr:hypothetical protein B0H17DRAFT_1179385 [Mycena rosella]
MNRNFLSKTSCALKESNHRASLHSRRNTLERRRVRGQTARQAASQKRRSPLSWNWKNKRGNPKVVISYLEIEEFQFEADLEKIFGGGHFATAWLHESNSNDLIVKRKPSSYGLPCSAHQALDQRYLLYTCLPPRPSSRLAPSVFIIGGRGAVGRPLVDKFLKQKAQFQRIAVLADPAKVSRFADAQAKGVEIVVSYAGFNVVVSLAANAAMKLQPGMIEAAIAGGVRHFYPSEYGGDISVGEFWKNRYFRNKVVTRDHLAAKAKKHPDFRYTLLMTGPFTEYAVSSFNGINFEKHTVEPYGEPGAELSVTATPEYCHEIHRWLDTHPVRFREEQNSAYQAKRITWEKLMQYLGDVQSAQYKLTYLDPQGAALKQEEARKDGNEDEEVFWAGKSVMLNGSDLIPEPLNNGKFPFTSESAKETIQRLFGANNTCTLLRSIIQLSI